MKGNLLIESNSVQFEIPFKSKSTLFMGPQVSLHLPCFDHVACCHIASGAAMAPGPATLLETHGAARLVGPHRGANSPLNGASAAPARFSLA
jgi:hypothetical protein